MEKRKFSLTDFNLEARIAQLQGDRARALEEVANILTTPGYSLDKMGLNREAWLNFCLPLAEFGLSPEQMLDLTNRVPVGFPFDHRQIYFDFRLGHWIKHIEPPTISESLEEYLENSESFAQGMAYLKGQWQAFLERQGQLSADASRRGNV